MASHGPVMCMPVQTFFTDSSSIYAQAEALEQESAQLKAKAQFMKQADGARQSGWQSRSGSPVPCRAAYADQSPWMSRSGSPVPCPVSSCTQPDFQNEAPWMSRSGSPVPCRMPIAQPSCTQLNAPVISTPVATCPSAGVPIITCFVTPCPQTNFVLPTMTYCEGWGPASQEGWFPAGQQDTRTATMMRNLPNDYTRDMVLELLDVQGFKGRYDFFYLPVDFQRNSGLGYAFVNFVTHVDAANAQRALQGFNSWKIPSQKVLEVTWSGFSQGLEANIERYQNSSVMHPSVPEEFQPLLFVNGVRTCFPKPTKQIKQPRVKVTITKPQNEDKIAVPTPLKSLLTPWQRIMKTISEINSQNLERVLSHARNTLAKTLCFSVPGVTDELTSVDQVCVFHRRLHVAIPDLSLALDHIGWNDKVNGTLKWRVTCTGTQVKQFIPGLPVGASASFALEVTVTQSTQGMPVHITWNFAAPDADSQAVLESPRGTLKLQEVKELSSMEMSHRRMDCQPCAYFAFRTDGCRAGDDCEFCHLCSKSEAKAKKKAKGKMLKAAEAAVSTDSSGESTVSH